MKIKDIRATTVTVPLEAPLRHANGVHWGRFVRTIVEVETDNGLIGLGEMGGGGESAEAAFRAMKSYLVGHDPGAPRRNAFSHREPHRVAVQQPNADTRGAGVCVPRHSWSVLGSSRSRRSSEDAYAIV
jgi:L-alanine-DL-glutamate epimerase-like enolase superfamily enzyme